LKIITVAMTPDQLKSPSPDRLQALRRMKAKKFSRYFLMLVLLVTTVVFFNVIKFFLVPVMLAAVFAGMFYPLYRWWLKIFRNQNNVSAFVSCLILLLGLLIPTYVVANLVSREAIAFYQTAEQKIREIIAKGDEGLLGEIKRSEWVQQLQLDKIDWQASVEEGAKTAAKLLASVINKASQGTFQLVGNLFLTLFAMYYFFRDGERIIARLKFLTPLADEYEEALINRFMSVARATIKGTLLIGVLKGSLGALTFWIFGVNSPVLWGVVMIILSVIPMVGAWLVMYPAAIIMMITGQVWQGIAVFLIAAIIIGNIDNVLMPRLVGREAGMHDLLIFFSTLGGIFVFGVMGFIVGPILAALFITILDIYSIEFRSQLELIEGFVAESQAGKIMTPAEEQAQELTSQHGEQI
jgi:predicted PurR-regulated permease PerM